MRSYIYIYCFTTMQVKNEHTNSNGKWFSSPRPLKPIIFMACTKLNSKIAFIMSSLRNNGIASAQHVLLPILLPVSCFALREHLTLHNGTWRFICTHFLSAVERVNSLTSGGLLSLTVHFFLDSGWLTTLSRTIIQCDSFMWSVILFVH